MHVHEQVAHRVMRSVLAPRGGAGQGRAAGAGEALGVLGWGPGKS